MLGDAQIDMIFASLFGIYCAPIVFLRAQIPRLWNALRTASTFQVMGAVTLIPSE